MNDNIIRLRTARNILHRLEDDGIINNNLSMDQITAIRLAEFAIDELCDKPIDVQPKSQWISVEDRLPEDDGDCLVWYRCDTVFGKSESWGIAPCSRGDWYTKHLHGDNIVVLYWQSMPKPPKEDC